MTIARTELTPEEKATQTLAAADHSVTLINNLVADTAYTANNATEEVLSSIDRNYRHLNIILERDYVIANNGGANLAVYSTAANSGKVYIESAKTANNANATSIVTSA